jgi:hypothetical protein
MTGPVFVSDGAARVRVLTRAVEDAQRALADEMVKQVAEVRGEPRR